MYINKKKIHFNLHEISLKQYYDNMYTNLFVEKHFHVGQIYNSLLEYISLLCLLVYHTTFYIIWVGQMCLNLL